MTRRMTKTARLVDLMSASARESCHMQRFSAFLGVGAMLLAFFTAPLFHLHDRDDHGRPAPLVHAHFFESEATAPHSDNEIEMAHSHHAARWVEFYTYNAP